MAELGMKESDLPPTIPESSPPHTPVQSPEDKFTLQKGTPVQIQEVCINVNDPLYPKVTDIYSVIRCQRRGIRQLINLQHSC